MKPVLTRLAAFCLASALIAGAASPANATPTREMVLELARRGWVYELSTAAMRRGPNMPPVRISPQSFRGARICILGEEPHPATRAVLQGFAALLERTFGTGPKVDLHASGNCAGQPVVLRLFSVRSPHGEFNADLRALDDAFLIGLSRKRMQLVSAPAQAQTFFGARGQATHIIVMQPEADRPLTPLEQRFYASILIEELYQAFTFGRDIMIFDPEVRPISKLQEYPVYLRNLPWRSTPFMEGILTTSVAGLCGFDVFMLHALGQARMASNSDALLQFLDAAYDDLARLTAETVALPDFAGILDPGCADPPR